MRLPRDPLRAYPDRVWPDLPESAALAAIVPALDEATRIHAQVRYLFELGVEEVIVVDGGSSDATAERARDAGARVLTAGRGRGRQMNAGAAATQAPILWFVHADARPDPSTPAALREALRDPRVVGGAFRIRTVNDAGRSLVDPLLPIANLRASYTLLPYGDQALFVRRDAFEAVGGFHAEPLFEDVVLARRLWRIGRLRVLPGPVRVSGRRFIQRPVQSALIMNLFPAAWVLGASPERLERWYARVR